MRYDTQWAVFFFQPWKKGSLWNHQDFNGKSGVFSFFVAQMASKYNTSWFDLGSCRQKIPSKMQDAIAPSGKALRLVLLKTFFGGKHTPLGGSSVDLVAVDNHGWLFFFVGKLRIGLWCVPSTWSLIHGFWDGADPITTYIWAGTPTLRPWTRLRVPFSLNPPVRVWNVAPPTNPPKSRP